MVHGGTATMADVVRWGYVRKVVLRGRRIEPGNYRQVRGALSEIADPIGRGGGRGRPLIWRLKDQPAATGAHSKAGMAHCREARPSNSNFLATLHSGLEQAHEGP
jgi:hypothetical protein